MTYALDNAWSHAEPRLTLLAQSLNPTTEQRLERIGVRPGWRCLEVGAGLGCTARFLAERVGPSGQVIATDLDDRFMATVRMANVEVWKHDITADELPSGRFDLIHARWLMYHLRDPAAVVRKLVDALRPGGSILLEDVDFFPLSASLIPEFAAFMQALAAEVGRASNHDGYWAAQALPRLLVEQSELGDLDVAVAVDVLRGGTSMARFWQLTAEQMRFRLISNAHVTEKQFEDAVSNLHSRDFWSYATANVGASARLQSRRTRNDPAPGAAGR